MDLCEVELAMEKFSDQLVISVDFRICIIDRKCLEEPL